jgi:UDP-N-acetylmuramate--alanine ligase
VTKPVTTYGFAEDAKCAPSMRARGPEMHFTVMQEGYPTWTWC